MKYLVNECCDCANDTYPCIGDSCGLKHVIRYKCDDCGKDELTEDEVHHIDGMDLCDECYQDYTMWDDYDYCYECQGYGDDYSFDDDGELVDNCTDCAFNPYRKENDDE